MSHQRGFSVMPTILAFSLGRGAILAGSAGNKRHPFGVLETVGPVSKTGIAEENGDLATQHPAIVHEALEHGSQQQFFMISIARLPLAGGCLVALLVALSFTHPFGTPRNAPVPDGRLFDGAQISEALREVVERKCGNCHSETVQWPFYSRVAPISWLVEHDVSEARKRMNLSRWNAYGNREKLDLLSRFAAKARSGEMPPSRYTAIHRNSTLSRDEQDSLYDWARGERKRLRAGNQ